MPIDGAYTGVIHRFDQNEWRQHLAHLLTLGVIEVAHVHDGSRNAACRLSDELKICSKAGVKYTGIKEKALIYAYCSRELSLFHTVRDIWGLDVQCEAEAVAVAAARRAFEIATKAQEDQMKVWIEEYKQDGFKSRNEELARMTAAVEKRLASGG